jgi:DNA-binding NarL/FixJ family response regulator
VKSPGLANPAEMMKFPGPAVSLQSREQPDYLTEIAEKFKFTPREIQILHGILCDKTTAEICGELNISIGTVKTHTHNIYMKVQVKSRQELIRALAEHR